MPGDTRPASQVEPVVVEMSGDLDLYSAPCLRDALLNAHRCGWLRVIVDMTELKFMDSSGLGVLIGGWKQARAAGGCVVLVGVPENVLRILRITGMVKIFPVFEAVPEAVAYVDEAYR